MKFVRFLATSPKLERNRPRAIAVSGLLILGIIGVLQFVPFPSHFRAPGVTQATEWTQVINEAPGTMAELLAAPGSRVAAGQPLVRLHNPEMEIEMAHARASQMEVESRIRVARAQATPNLKPLFESLEAATNRVAKLLRDQSALTLIARHDGLWVAPEIRDYEGRWLPRGTVLGLLVNPAAFQFTAVVQQEYSERLFGRELRGAEVRLFGEVGQTMRGERWEIVPDGQRILPTPALGWQGGGPVPVLPDDRTGTRTAEPYFAVLVKLPADVPAHLLHGRTGIIRFAKEPEPLLPRWLRSLRQLLQKRYQI